MPHTPQAVEALQAQDVDENTEVTFLHIDDDGAFNELWESGLFTEINRGANTLIDDYEEEVVWPEAFQHIRAAIEIAAKSNPSNARLATFLQWLGEVTDEAERRGMPLVFIL